MAAMSVPSGQDVRQQGQEAGPLDGDGELALLLGGHRGDPARHDLAALAQEARQQAHVLVVDLRRVRARERAGLATAIEWPASADSGATGGWIDFCVGHCGLLLQSAAEFFVAEAVPGAKLLAVIKAATTAALKAPGRLRTTEAALTIIRLAGQDG